MARLRSAPGSSQVGRPIAADSQLLLIDRSAKPVRRPRSGAGGHSGRTLSYPGVPGKLDPVQRAAVRDRSIRHSTFDTSQQPAEPSLVRRSRPTASLVTTCASSSRTSRSVAATGVSQLGQMVGARPTSLSCHDSALQLQRKLGSTI
eukprot:COSAG01_NODE_2820_length_7012_cov_5.502965_6_plen_147_part_00